MKAWTCRDEMSGDDYGTVVFAETRGKAKSIALTCDACEDAEFRHITARRIPSLDRFYRDKDEMDWNDPDDRVAMVRYGGFYCSYEMLKSELRCDKCPAKQWCSRAEEEE